MAPCVRVMLSMRAIQCFSSADNDKTTIQVTTNRPISIYQNSAKRPQHMALGITTELVEFTPESLVLRSIYCFRLNFNVSKLGYF